MPSTPTMLPDSAVRRMAIHAVPAVLAAAGRTLPPTLPDGAGKARQRIARHYLLGDIESDSALHPVLRGGARILLDAAEEGTKRLTAAGIDAAIAGCKCAPNPDPKAVAVLKGFVDCLVEGAFAGLRSASRV